MPAITLLPTGLFQLFLVTHHLKHIIALDIFRPQLHDHSTIAPSRSAIGRAHAIDHNLLFIGSSRNDKSARTHTERIYTTAVDLCYKRVFGSGKIFATPLFAVILNLIDELGRMLKTHTDSNAFWLYLNL